MPRDTLKLRLLGRLREIKQQTSTGDWAASPVLTEAERAAAALRAIEQDPNLRRMFETAGLDTSNVLHWQRLLSSVGYSYSTTSTN
jgi:hypothetical protein